MGKKRQHVEIELFEQTEENKDLLPDGNYLNLCDYVKMVYDLRAEFDNLNEFAGALSNISSEFQTYMRVQRIHMREMTKITQGLRTLTADYVLLLKRLAAIQNRNFLLTASERLQQEKEEAHVRSNLTSAFNTLLSARRAS